MKINVPINISARHVHLTKEVYDKLFDNDITIYKELNQVGQFATNERVTIKTDKGEFNNVRIVGPYRTYNQVEISKSDARVLGINPPVRTSGDLDSASVVTIKTAKGEVTLPCAIIADRHVHMNPQKAEELGVKDGEKLMLAINSEKKGIIEVNAKVSDDGYFEVHLDTDDSNAFLIHSNMEGILFKKD